MTISTVSKFHQYAQDIMALRYSHVVSGRKESWLDITNRVCDNVLRGKHMTTWLHNDVFDSIYEAIYQRKFIPGGRILSQAGRNYHQTDNCFCLQAEDTREGWAELAHKTTMMFMSGGGVGCDYSNIRAYGHSLKRSGGVSSGPIPLIKMINSIASAARQGGERRGANYASLLWSHGDIDQFIEMKTNGQSLKHTNISVRFDKEYFSGPIYNKQAVIDAKNGVFMKTLKHACQYGDPGFQFDADDQVLRNACTEIITADNEDSCCLGSVNLARIDSLQELKEITQLGILFLLCNTLYTDCPTDKVRKVKDKNRRLGLGLMGVAEWFIQRNLPYGYIVIEDDKYAENNIASWLHHYKCSSESAAEVWASKLNIATPIATRAIAPTGTISTAIGFTTPGIEPIFCSAYQRTYNTLKSKEYFDGYKREIVIDPVVQKLLDEGQDVSEIDTAWSLSKSIKGIDRRLSFQAFVQRFVDNGISSTVNLPSYVEGVEEKIAPLLLKYLPMLRGVTFYPDGRYNNQPIVAVDLADAVKETRQLWQSDVCKIEGCGA